MNTEDKTHVIITFTKSHHLITKKEHELLYTLGADEDFETSDGSKIGGNNIAEVLPIEKYYEVYPEKHIYRRSDEVVDFEQLDAGYNGVINRSSVKGIQEMMKGFLKYGSKDNELYKHMERKLREKQNAIQ